MLKDRVSFYSFCWWSSRAYPCPPVPLFCGNTNKVTFFFGRPTRSEIAWLYRGNW